MIDSRKDQQETWTSKAFGSNSSFLKVEKDDFGRYLGELKIYGMLWATTR